MLPGRLKEVFSQVVRARQDGLAALERARSETATLRHLANAAKMIESHPALLQLRLAQALAGGSGNSLVLGVPSEAAKSPLGTAFGARHRFGGHEWLTIRASGMLPPRISLLAGLGNVLAPLAGM